MSDCSKVDAYAIAEAAIENLGVEFGDEDWDWSIIGAHELADEELQYWSED